MERIRNQLNHFFPYKCLYGTKPLLYQNTLERFSFRAFNNSTTGRNNIARFLEFFNSTTGRNNIARFLEFFNSTTGRNNIARFLEFYATYVPYSINWLNISLCMIEVCLFFNTYL